MGMSDDFEVAIEEGATIVRVGRALFGERHGAHTHGHRRRTTSTTRAADRPTRPRLVDSVSSTSPDDSLDAPSDVLSFSDVRFAVRLTPRSAVERVEGVVDGVLKVRVMAPAVEGAANTALIRLLADELGIARRDVRIVAGATSRQKLVVVEGVEEEAIVARWPGLRV